MSNILSDQQRLYLKNIMKEHNIDDNTNNIKGLKHSALIKTDVNHLLFIKKKHADLKESDPDGFDNICIRECNFLFNNYTDIFNKIKKDLIDLNILDYFIKTLKQIEDGELNQNEGSYLVGELLKKIYIDSALKREKKLNDENTNDNNNNSKYNHKEVSYSQYKAMLNNNQIK